jgi:hypothetical protein
LAKPIELNAISASFWVNSSYIFRWLVPLHVHVDPTRHNGFGFRSIILSMGSGFINHPEWLYGFIRNYNGFIGVLSGFGIYNFTTLI